MTSESKGPVATEIENRLRASLAPSHLAVINDSEQHRGHGGYDAESHFTVEVVADAFAGQNRVARQRLVNSALGDLMREKVHALSIRAKAPGE